MNKMSSINRKICLFSSVLVIISFLLPVRNGEIKFEQTGLGTVYFIFIEFVVNGERFMDLLAVFFLLVFPIICHIIHLAYLLKTKKNNLIIISMPTLFFLGFIVLFGVDGAMYAAACMAYCDLKSIGFVGMSVAQIVSIGIVIKDIVEDDSLPPQHWGPR